LQRGQHRREQVRGGDLAGRDPHGAAGGLPQARERAPEPVRAGFHLARRVRDRQRRCGRRHAAAGALEQRRAELRLELGHVAAECRLLRAQRTRGTRQAARVEHRDEAPDQRPVEAVHWHTELYGSIAESGNCRIPSVRPHCAGRVIASGAIVVNTASRTVLVLGANGRFGAVATRAFTDAGWQVLAQARRAPAALPAGARHLATSIEQTEALAREARGAAVVVHAANPVYTRWTREAVPLARAGMDVAARLGATFMLPGNVYNFGASMPALLDEDTPQRPSSRKGRIRATIEAELQARAADGLRGVVIRAGDFFGAGTGSWFDQVIVRSLRSGTLVYPGPLDVAHAWAYLPDLARAFVAVAELDDLPAFTRLHFAGHSPTG